MLFGRFSTGVRERLRRRILASGGSPTRDLTRRSEALVVGALASPLIGRGVLAERLDVAWTRGLPVYGERGFLQREEAPTAEEAATLPIGGPLQASGLTVSDLRVLAAFDLVVLDGAFCRFSDASRVRTAGELMGEGRSLADTVRILVRARDLSPHGRHKIVLTASGEAALQWQDGLTTLDGQGFLPLDIDQTSVEALFDAAVLAEADGDVVEAERLYDLCGRMDASDGVAFYNLANLQLGAAEFEKAALSYQRSLSRDPAFAEARYNLAQALEALGRPTAAAAELERLIEIDSSYGDAMFNLAQLRMHAGDLGEASALFERYLALEPTTDLAAKARRALIYCRGSG